MNGAVLLDGAVTAKPLSLLATAIVLLTACGDDAPPVGTVVHPTLVGVDPNDFLGNVPCLDAAGAMRRYVLTLTDVTPELGEGEDPAGAFDLPSTSAVPCDRIAASAFVVPEHGYIAQISGFDRADLVPLSPGSPIMIDPGTSASVAPRWTTECGALPTGEGAGGAGATSGAGAGGAPSSDEPIGGAAGAPMAPDDAVAAPETAVLGVTARARQTVLATHCRPLEQHAEPTPTGVRIDLSNALGDLRCGTGPGEVVTFTVTLDGTAETQTVDCIAIAEFSGLTPDQPVSASVTAFSTDPALSWSTTCYGKTRAQVMSPLSCDRLTAAPE